MKSRRKWGALLAPFLGFALIASGCGDSGSKTAAAPTTTQGVTATTTPVTTGTATEFSSPRPLPPTGEGPPGRDALAASAAGAAPRVAVRARSWDCSVRCWDATTPRRFCERSRPTRQI